MYQREVLVGMISPTPGKGIRIYGLLIPPGTQYGATLSNPVQRKPLRYAVFARLCTPLQRLMDHSYLEQVSGSSPLVGSLFYLQNL